MAKYTALDKQNAIDFVDSHPELPIEDAAKKLGVEKNTLYSWTSKAGRKAIGEAVKEIRAVKAKHPSAVFQAYSIPEPVKADRAEAPTNDTARRLEELERENAFQKKIIEAYRERFGV
jgi:uncharacterized protein YjcR